MFETTQVNPEYVVLAREARGLTQAEFANEIDLEQGSVSKIENGLIPVSDAILDRIVTVLGFPKTYFTQPGIPERVKGHYRKKLTLPSKELKKTFAWMTMAEQHLLRLLRPLEIPAAKLPKWDVLTDGSPEDAAKYVRNFWRINKGRVLSLSKLLEDNGIIIVPLDLGETDGFSTFIDRRIPVIFLNRNRPGDRQRLTLAHELGHLVMHFEHKISEARNIEEEAYQFAAEFLIPVQDFIQTFHRVVTSQRINIDRLAQLKLFWHVSMQALLKRAHELNLITKDQYSYQWRVFNAKGMRTNEGVHVPPEEPGLLKEIFAEYQNELNYTTEHLAKVLLMQESDFVETYMSDRPKLKIIRRLT
jgi:Zn-dependent peptidase ImmA (M78 family)/transcriptional regulator with XRE-family HTH domain